LLAHRPRPWSSIDDSMCAALAAACMMAYLYTARGQGD
jgi:hypothetical protein